MRLVVATLTLGLMLVAGSAGADGLKVKPGKWEIRTTSENPMAPAPQTHVTQECVTDSQMQPDFFQDDASQCSVVKSEVKGSSMTWQVKCKTQGGEMLGDGNLTSKGDTMTGGMKLTMNFNGQTMTMKQSWQGKHLGPCD